MEDVGPRGFVIQKRVSSTPEQISNHVIAHAPHGVGVVVVSTFRAFERFRNSLVRSAQTERWHGVRHCDAH